MTATRSKKPLAPNDSHDAALLELFRAIASRNPLTARRLLEEFPELVRWAIKIGATRGAAKPYFFHGIGHYAYAGDTALQMAAAAHAPDVARQLVSKGADVRARNRRGAEPLHYASDGGPGSDAWNPDAQHAVVELLIRAGADPNAKDKSGVAPLHRAVRTRCSPAVRALLANGADVAGKNDSGSTPLHLAVQNTGRGGSGSPAAQEEQAEIIRILLGHGARPSARDASGRCVKECAKAEWIRALLGEAR